MFILLILYTFFVFIRPQDYIPFFSKIPVMPVLLILMFIGFLLLKDKRFDLPQDKFIFFFFIATFVAHLFHLYFGGLAYVLSKLFPAILIYYIMTNTLVNLERIEKYFQLIIILSLILAAHGIHQYFNGGVGWTGQTFAKKTTRIRYIGIFSDPNDLSLVFLFSIPLSLYFYIKKESFIRRLVYLVLAAIFIYGIILTQSRGAMVSLASMVAYFAIRRYGLKKGVIIGLILLLPVLIIGSKEFSRISTDEESAYGRIDSWYEGIQMLLSSPLWGVGVGMFTEYNPLTAHNSFVLCFAETGFLGYFFWIGAIYYNFIGLNYSIEYEKIDNENNLLTPSFFLTISLIGFLTASFFLSRTYTIILYMIMGLITSYLYATNQDLGWEYPSKLEIRDIKNILMLEFGTIIAIYIFVKFSVH